MRFQYVLKEAFTNIKRNGLVVLGAILAVFISLFLTFGTLIFGEIARINTQRWSEDVRVIAFVRDDFRDVEELQETVESWNEVDQVFFYSKAQAYEEALDLFRNNSAVRRVIEENPQIVPASLRVRPVELDQYATIEARLKNSPGIEEVRSAGPAVDQIAAIRDGLGVFFWVLATALGLAAVALIANTIHMAIYARREELEIMKLVGAGNWFVRTPFLIEGVVEGLLGAGAAVGVVWGLYQLAQTNLEGLPSFIDIVVGNEFLARWALLILGFGILVGALGSFLSLAVHRYIRT
jgi:cell division transport system permease protein